MTDEYPKLLKTEQVAELLGMSADKVRRAARDGTLPVYRLPGGRTHRFFRDEILEWEVQARLSGWGVPRWPTLALVRSKEKKPDHAKGILRQFCIFSLKPTLQRAYIFHRRTDWRGCAFFFALVLSNIDILQGYEEIQFALLHILADF